MLIIIDDFNPQLMQVTSEYPYKFSDVESLAEVVLRLSGPDNLEKKVRAVLDQELLGFPVAKYLKELCEKLEGRHENS